MTKTYIRHLAKKTSSRIFLLSLISLFRSIPSTIPGFFSLRTDRDKGDQMENKLIHHIQAN